MAGSNKNITIGVRYQLDENSVLKIRESLKQISNLTASGLNDKGATANLRQAEQEIDKVKASAKELQTVLERSFNADLGTLNVTKFNQELKKLDLNTIYKNMSLVGAEGTSAFRSIAAAAMSSNLKLKETKSLVDKMGDTFANTIRWNVASGAINAITSSISSSVSYVKKLDASLNDIRIVTDKSAEDMERFAVSANKAAKALAAQTNDYTKASLIYYQQGLDDEDVAARAETTLKAANVTGQSTSTVSEQLTAVWNGYKVSASEAESYIDKLAAVAATTASDLEELSTGMSKVASAANAMGVDADQLNAQLATIVSVTRQAPESVGTALKTIYARMSQIQAGTDEEGVTLGNYTSKMAEMGVNVLNANGQLRDMGDVIEEVGSKWASMSREQQIALAQTMAGTRQYNSLLALFENFDMYNDALKTSQNSLGTLQHQQEIYLESTAAHIDQMRASAEDLYDSLLSSKDINTFTDILKGLLETFTTFIDAIGGGRGALLAFGSLATSVFSKQLAQNVMDIAAALTIEGENQKKVNAEMEVARTFQRFSEKNLEEGSAGRKDFDTLVSQKLHQGDVYGVMSAQQYNTTNDLLAEEDAAMKARDANAALLNAVRELTTAREEALKVEENHVSILTEKGELTTEGRKGIEDDIKATKDQVAAVEEYSSAIDTLISLREEYQGIVNSNKAYNSDNWKEQKRAEFTEKVNKKFYGENNEVYNAGLHKATQKALSSKKNAGKDLNTIELEVAAKYEKKIKEQAEKEIERRLKQSMGYYSKKREAAKDDFKGYTKGENLQGLKGVLDNQENYLSRNAPFLSSDLSNQLTAAQAKIKQALVNPTLTNTEELKKTWNEYIQLLQQASDDIVKNGGVALNSVEKLETEQEKYNQKVEDTKAKVEAWLKSFDAANKVRGIFETIGGFGQTVSAVNSAVNAIKTLKDDDLSAWEKISQLSMSIPFALSMFSNGLGRVYTGLKKVIGAQALENLSVTKLIAKYLALGTAQKLLIGAGVLAGIAVLAVGIAKLVEHYSNLETEVEKANKRLEASKAAAESATSAYKELADEINNYKDLVKGLDDLIEGTEEYTEQLEKASEAAKALAKSNSNFTLDYTNGYASISEDQLEAEEKKAKNRVNRATVASNLNQNRVNNLEYEEDRQESAYKDLEASNSLSAFYQNSIEFQNAIEKALKEGLTDRDVYKGIVEDIIGDVEDDSETGQYLTREIDVLTRAAATALADNNPEDFDFYKLGETEEALEKLAEELKTLNNKNLPLLKEAIDKTGELDSSGTYNDLDNKTQDVIQRYIAEKLSDAKLEKFYNDVDNAFNNGSEEERRKAYADATGAKYHSNGIWTDIAGNLLTGDDKVTDDDLAEAFYNKVYNDLFSKLVGSDLSAESSVASHYEEKYGISGTAFGGMRYGYKPEASDLSDLSTVISDLHGLKELYSAFDNQEDWSLAGNLSQTIATYTEGVKTAMDSLKESLSTIDTDSLSEAIMGGESLEDFKELEAYTALANQIENIKIAFPELSAAAETFMTDGLYGTHEWIEAFEQLQTQIEGTGLETLNDNFKDLFEETDEDGKLLIRADLDSDEFKTAIDKILDAEYAIDVEIHSNAEDEFDSLSSAFDDIEEQASKIGEQYVVSADDIREIGNAFPGILENAQMLADGTIQLNESTVQSAMAAAQATMAADAEATEEKLLNAEKELRTRQSIYRAQAEAFRTLAATEGLTEEKKKQVKENALKQLQNLDAQSTKDEISNEEAAAQASYDFGNQVALNWASAYEESANKAISFAKVAIAAAKQAAAGDKGDISNITPEDFNINYKGSTGSTTATTTDSTNIQRMIEGASEQQDYLDIANAFDNAADVIEKQIIDIQSMRVGASASLLEKVNGLQNVKGGKGYSPSDSKSSSDKSKDPDQMDYLEEERDRYHDINIEIKNLETQLSKLEKLQKKLAGGDLINSYQDQLEILQDQVEAQKEKLGIAVQEAGELKYQLEAQGVTFDENDNISNYMDIMKAKLDGVNSIIADYNALSAEEQEQFKPIVEAAKEGYEQFKKQVENYDNLVSETIPEIEQAIQDKLDEEIEIKIKAFKAEVDIRLNMADAEREWNDFKKKVIDEIKDSDNVGNATANLENLKTYFDTFASGSGDIQNLTDQVNKTLEQIHQIEETGTSDTYGDNRAQALEDLQDYYKKLMDALGEVKDVSKEIREGYLTTIDDVSKALEEQTKQYEIINKFLDHDVKLVQLMYGDDAYAEMANYYDQIHKNNLDNLDFMRQQTEYYKQMFDNETDEDAKKKWKELWQSSAESLNSALESALQNTIDKYKNAVDEVIDRMADKATNGLGLDYVETEWDLINKQSEQYLDEVNEVFAIHQLEAKYLEAINNANDVGDQQRLNALMNEQLTQLREKDKLTQYDVDRANKLYDIELKRMALQDAQNNKSKLRLRRDSQGNFSYQYVADDEGIAKAQQELEEAQNNLYNFDKDRYKESIKEVEDLTREYAEALKALNEDVTLSDEERNRQKLLLAEYYEPLIQHAAEESEVAKLNTANSAFDALKDRYDLNLQDFLDMTEEEKVAWLGDQGLIPEMESGIARMAETFAGEDGFVPISQQALAELDEATNQYKNDLQLLEESAGINFENIKNGIDADVAKTKELLTANNDLITQQANIVTAYQAVLDKLKELEDKYDKISEQAKQAASDAYTTWQTNALLAVGYKDAVNASIAAVETALDGMSIKLNNVAASANNAANAVASLANSVGAVNNVKLNIPDTPKRGNTSGGSHHNSSTGGGGGVNLAMNFDTGGYTGDWNSKDGRVAVLHEKELVLNKLDTQNILNAVSAIRGMNPTVMNRLTGLNVSSGSVGGASNSTEMAQTVYINAEFKDATTASEITNALNNLVNTASQHVMNPKRYSY